MNTAPVPYNTTLTEDRAASLLGSGIKPEIVASSLGISHARISQLLSDEQFAARVAELRYQNLAKHNARDDKADSLEDTILSRLEDEISLVHRPMELAKLYQIINGAKRRGVSTPEAIIEKQAIVQLVVPMQIINKFQTNLQGQVTTVGERDLLTIQSGALDSLVKEHESRKEIKNGSPTVDIRTISIDQI